MKPSHTGENHLKMSMDVLYSINGNGKTIGKSSLYLAMTKKILRNGYIKILLLFHMVSMVVGWRKFMFLLCSTTIISYHIYINKSISGNETTVTYGPGTYSKEQELKEVTKR